MRGRLIAFEGIDGCGKSTQARLLARSLGGYLTSEPGSTHLGRSLRGLLLDSSANISLSPRAEALLMAADRAQHVEEMIRPALESGTWVVTDRYSGSTLAYQGFGQGISLETLTSLVAFAEAGVAADLTVLIDLDPDTALSRRSGRAEDRLEELGLDFQRRVAAGYRQLVEAHPLTWVRVSGEGPVEEVAARVIAVVRDRLSPLPSASQAV